MGLKRTSHAVYDTRYHLVWVPKYRKWVLQGEIRDTAKEIFRRHPEVKKELWGGQFWEDGYFVRTVGDKVTSETIKKYIQYHRHSEATPNQLELSF